MGKCIDNEDDDGYYIKVFACPEGSLRDLTFTRYDLNLEEGTIVPIFTVIKLCDWLYTENRMIFSRFYTAIARYSFVFLLPVA